MAFLPGTASLRASEPLAKLSSKVAAGIATAKRIAVLRDLIETRQRLAGAPRWLIRVEWWAERALRWGKSWFSRWALLRLAIAVSVIVPVGWTMWTYIETLREREQADRITALTLVNSNVPKDHHTVRQALAFLLSRKISLRSASLGGAKLAGASLSGADLSGADLGGAKALTQMKLDSACIYEPSGPINLPEELKPPTTICPER